MALNQVQVKLVNEVVRPWIEQVIRMTSQMDAFLLDMNNQQVPLPTTAVNLDDNADGTAPRADAPVLTGQMVENLRLFTTTMRGAVSAQALQQLVSASVRPVEQILR